MSAVASRISAKPSGLPLAALLLGGIAIGTSAIFVRLSEIGPTATAFHRMLWAVPWLWLWARSTGGDARVFAQDPRTRRTLVICGLLFAGDLALWHLSILYTSVANATLFANFAPVVVTLGAWLFLKERITREFLIGLALALAGAGMLMGASVQTDHRHVIGDALGIATAFFYGAYLLTVAGLRVRLPAPTIMFWSSIVTGLALALLAIAAGESLWPQSARGLALLVVFALVTQVAGQGMIAYALGHLPAAFSSLVILIQPVAAAVFGWMILDEPLAGLQFAGGATILAGILIARRANN